MPAERLTVIHGGKHEGQIRGGKAHGKGKAVWTGRGSKHDGEYVGEHKDDKRHGKGVMTFASGDKYDGEGKDNKRRGKGVCTCARPTGEA